METAWGSIGKEVEYDSSYPTYEEWKQLYLFSAASIIVMFLSYL